MISMVEGREASWCVIEGHSGSGRGGKNGGQRQCHGTAERGGLAGFVKSNIVVATWQKERGKPQMAVKTVLHQKRGGR
jgi:hypothetical protein